MWNKTFKIIFVSEEHSKIKEFNFSRIKIILLLLLSGGIMLSLAGLGVNFLTEQLYNFRLKRLEKERMAFRHELSIMKQKTKSLQEEMNKIIKHDDQMRTIVDIQKYDEDIRNVGIGGTELPKLTFSSYFAVEERMTNSLLENLDKIERLIGLESESFFEIQQAFLRNKDLAQHYPSIRPVDGGKLTDRYGPRTHPISGERDFHYGIDLSCPRGTPVKAPADGIVVVREWNASMGKFIRINHDAKNYGFETCYGHLNDYRVKVGQKVKRGDIIGYVGMTGLTTAPHLHYEIVRYGKHVDPLAFYYDPSILY